MNALAIIGSEPGTGQFGPSSPEWAEPHAGL